MRLLLDTCTFLWLIGFPERLPDAVRECVEDAGNDCAVSVASIWECLIKQGKGRLGLTTGGRTALDFLLQQCQNHQLDVLPIHTSALHPLERLPPLHHDPFDRLLICQAIEQGLTILTPDPLIQRYPVRTFW